MVEIGWEQRIYPAAKIAIVVDSLAAEGVPVAEALRRTSLSPSDLRSPATQVSVNQVIESYRNAVRLSRAPHFAFETGLKTHVSHYGMYGFAILSSMNFRETMHFAVKYHQLATPVVKLQFREEASRADWTVDPLPHPAVDTRLHRFIVETQFGILASLHRDIMGSAFRPLALEVTFTAPESEDKYTAEVGWPVSFQQPGNRFLFEADWLNGAPQFGDETHLRVCPRPLRGPARSIAKPDRRCGKGALLSARHIGPTHKPGSRRGASWRPGADASSEAARRRNFVSRSIRRLAGGGGHQVFARYPLSGYILR